MRHPLANRIAISTTAIPIVAAAGLALVVACATVPLPLGREYGRKPVVRKEEPNTLLAGDGTRCQVSRATFTNVALQSEATCVWRPNDPGDRALGPAAVGSSRSTSDRTRSR